MAPVIDPGPRSAHGLRETAMGHSLLTTGADSGGWLANCHPSLPRSNNGVRIARESTMSRPTTQFIQDNKWHPNLPTAPGFRQPSGQVSQEVSIERKR